MAIRLHVSNGPEAGRTVLFKAPVVTIGRGRKNDLILQDGRVSQYHGELVLRADGYVYRDLMSRHGTLVMQDHTRTKLHNRRRPEEIALVSGARLILGETAVRLEFSLQDSDELDAYSDLLVAALPEPQEALGRRWTVQGEQILTRTHDSLDAVTKRLSSQDPRLVSIFRLSRSLNAASDLDEMLNLIIEATFEAFPAANFFAITLLSEEAEPGDIRDATTLVSRVRKGQTFDTTEPLLSKSLLEQVAQSQESVLFVRDQTNHEISQSIINARITACLAAPLVGQRKLIGVMQADTRGLGGLFGSDDLDLFTVMASYAAFSIERARLNTSIYEMFEGIVRASTKAIDARDPSTAGHSERVAQLCIDLALAINDVEDGPLADLYFTEGELRELRYAAMLHDFGKIGVRESILTKEERLHPWERTLIIQRFETIKASLAYRVLNDELRRIVTTGVLPRVEDVDRLNRAVQDVVRRVDERLAFLLEQQKAYQLTPQTRMVYQEIATETYLDLQGRKHPFLDPKELESLTTPSGTLTSAEWEDMKSHAAWSREYLVQIPWSSDLKRIPALAAGHHEKLDGSGYPDGLREDQLPPRVRLMTICDIYDALTAIDRPYRKAHSVEAAIAALERDAASGLLDRDVVSLFKAMMLKRIPVTRGSAEALEERWSG